MTDRTRILVAGAGLFGREHLRLLSGRDDVEVVGVADVNAAGAEAAAGRFGAGAFDTDATGLIDRLKPDGVIVATPAETHLPLATHALRAGIPVLLEKPVGVDAAEAVRLAEEEAASAAFVLPGHVLRFSPSHRKLAEIARSGIGRVLTVTSRRHRDDSHARRYPDVDPVLMTMIHDIDLAVWLTGAGAAEALALRMPPGDQRSATTFTARGTGGAAWHLATAWTFPGACPPDRLEVVGETGGVELEVGAFLRRYGATEERIDVSGEAWDDSLKAEQACFLDLIRTGRRPTVVTLADAIAGLLAAEAAMASLKSGEAVRLQN